MSGLLVLVRKELVEAWRTRRLPVLAVVFLLLGMVSALTARYMAELVALLVGDQLSIPIPTPTAAMAVDQLQKNLGQLGALAVIAISMGSVAGELDRGTAALILAQPVTRGAFLAAKLVALLVTVGISVLLATAGAWIYTSILFEPQPIGGWLALGALSWLALSAWGALTFLASAVTGSTMAAAGIGFGALIVLNLAAIVPAVDRLLPTGLGVPASQLAAGMTADLDAARLATALVGTLLLIGGSLGIALVAFRRREL
jgi:ABC-2 type transport system permease protein